VHKVRYGEGLLPAVPPPNQLADTAHSFFGAPSRASSRFSVPDIIDARAAASFARQASTKEPTRQRTHTRERPQTRPVLRQLASEEDMGVTASVVPPTMAERVPDVS
jgi:hypothetical protein